MNNVSLGGRLTRDPELRYFESGKMVAEVSIAIDGYKDKENPANDHTDFIQVKAWGKTGELVGEHFRKGDYFSFNGKIRQETWIDPDTEQNRSKIIAVANEINWCPKRSPKRDTENEETSDGPPPGRDNSPTRPRRP